MKPLMRFGLLLALFASPLSLTGCWDRMEINDMAIAVASAIDLEEDGKLRMSVQIPLVGQMGGMGGGGAGGGEKNYIVDSEVGNTIREINAKQQLKLPRRLFFSHRRVLLISEDVARTMGIREFFDVVSRVPENRLNANLVIVKGKAHKLLTMKPRLEKFSGESIREIVESENVMGTTMKDVAQMLNQYGVDPMIPYLATTDKVKKEDLDTATFKMMGYALFRDDKMVGVIRDDPTEGMRWLRQKFQPYGKTFDVKDGKVSLNIYKGKAEVTPTLLQDHIRFDVKVQAVAYMMESEAPIDFVEPAQVRIVEAKLAEEIRESLEKSVEAVQKYKSDAPQFGLLIARNYPRKWQMEYLPRWDEELSKAQFTYDVRVKISRIGLTSENIGKRERR